MKKRLIFIITISIVMVIGTYVYVDIKQQSKDRLSKLIFANIEALANDGETSSGGVADILSVTSEGHFDIEDSYGRKYNCYALRSIILGCSGEGNLECTVGEIHYTNLRDCYPIMEVR